MTAQERRLGIWLRVVAAITFVFFGTAFVTTVAGVATELGVLSALTTWGHGGEAYVLMIATIYLVFSVFLWISPRDLAGNRAFIDFSIVANLAHATLMLVASFTFPGEHAHLAGDVLGGYVLFLPLAALWLPVRRTLTA